jgi:hypothetical protein
LVGLTLGVIINIFSLTTVLLFILDKISLIKVETIISFSKFEGVVYLIFFVGYTVHTGLIYSEQLDFGISFLIMLIVVLLSFMNYVCFRNSFYAKLRIKSRIQFNPTTL